MPVLLEEGDEISIGEIVFLVHGTKNRDDREHGRPKPVKKHVQVLEPLIESDDEDGPAEMSLEIEKNEDENNRDKEASSSLPTLLSNPPSAKKRVLGELSVQVANISPQNSDGQKEDDDNKDLEQERRKSKRLRSNLRNSSICYATAVKVSGKQGDKENEKKVHGKREPKSSVVDNMPPVKRRRRHEWSIDRIFQIQ